MSFPSASALIARFLRSNNYIQTLDAFIREAGLPADAGVTPSSASSGSEEDGWTIEGIIQEKKIFDKSLNFERVEGEDGPGKSRNGWTEAAPSKPNFLETPSSANLLSVSVSANPAQALADENSTSSIIATGADRRLSVFSTLPGHAITASHTGLSDSPILSCAAVHDGEYLLSTSMSGQLLLSRDAEILDRRKDHVKYAVKVAVYEDAQSFRAWIATAGWDMKVHVYCLESGRPILGDPVASVKLPTNPESILFVRNRQTGDLVLLVSRQDCTYLFYYLIESGTPAPAPAPTLGSGSGSIGTTPSECRLLGKQNLAPHSNAWVAFSPSCVALSPHDPELVAVATSTQPHMKVMMVRLLFPSDPESTASAAPAGPAALSDPSGSLSLISLSLSADTRVDPQAPQGETQASQALAALALQNREDAAILINANTMAPQTAYSTPQVVWRPDGSGVWVNGDDGVIRGVETRTGKVVALLKDGHEAGSKVRSIWAGWVDVKSASRREEGEVEGEADTASAYEEWLLSGGFDKRLIVWKV